MAFPQYGNMEIYAESFNQSNFVLSLIMRFSHRGVAERRLRKQQTMNQAQHDSCDADCGGPLSPADKGDGFDRADR